MRDAGGADGFATFGPGDRRVDRCRDHWLAVVLCLAAGNAGDGRAGERAA